MTYITWEHPEANRLPFILLYASTCQNGLYVFPPLYISFYQWSTSILRSKSNTHAIRIGWGIQPNKTEPDTVLKIASSVAFTISYPADCPSLDNLPYISGFTKGSAKQVLYRCSMPIQKPSLRSRKKEDFLSSLAERPATALDDMKPCFGSSNSTRVTTNLKPDTLCNAFKSSLYQKGTLAIYAFHLA